ncbi:TRAP transporter substrate-binding protein [Fodinicurvata sp. EGI_FJ10296]|uniref:TRAP transporter substrate-binding protein n=1 Tax=Fodinicurvata sp. EGI_FJ10296 TaxID=3231908 RepID=UPI00345456B7
MKPCSKPYLTTATAVAALVSVAAGATGAAADDQTVLRFSNWLPPTHHVVTEMVTPWAEAVEEATEGRVTVEIVSALGDPPSHYDLVANGVADLAFGVHGYTPERFKLTEIGELPFTSNDAVVNSLAYWRTYEEFMMDAGEHDDVVLLGLWTNGPYQLFTNDTTLTSIDAVDGKRIRVPGAVVEQITQALDMTPISSPLTEAYEQVARGVIDGMFQQLETVVAFNMTEHMPMGSIAPGGFAHSSQFMVMNRDSFDSLSEADQEAIMELSGEAMALRFAEVWQEYEENAIAALEEEGATLHQIDDEVLSELQDLLAFVTENWVEAAEERDVDGQAALDFYHDQLAAVAEERDVSAD